MSTSFDKKGDEMMADEEAPAWCRIPEQRYGLLFLEGRWYIKDRLRSWRLETGRARPTAREREWGGRCGLGYKGRSYVRRERAEEVRQWLMMGQTCGVED